MHDLEKVVRKLGKNTISPRPDDVACNQIEEWRGDERGAVGSERSGHWLFRSDRLNKCIQCSTIQSREAFKGILF